MAREEVIIICRCNDITLRDLREALDMGIDDFEVLRRYLKIGFGPCQGRACILIAARYFASRYGRKISDVLVDYKIRPPIVPIPLRHLLVEGEE